MKYTTNFWELRKEARIKELAKRESNKDFLSNFAYIGHIDDQYGKQKILIKIPKKDDEKIQNYVHATELEWATLEKRCTEEFPTSHDSDWLATYFANILLTDYCYEDGINPATIEFILWDRRIPYTIKPTFFGRLCGVKEKRVVYQQVIVAIIQTGSIESSYIQKIKKNI